MDGGYWIITITKYSIRFCFSCTLLDFYSRVSYNSHGFSGIFRWNSGHMTSCFMQTARFMRWQLSYHLSHRHRGSRSGLYLASCFHKSWEMHGNRTNELFCRIIIHKATCSNKMCICHNAIIVLSVPLPFMLCPLVLWIYDLCMFANMAKWATLLVVMKITVSLSMQHLIVMLATYTSYSSFQVPNFFPSTSMYTTPYVILINMNAWHCMNSDLIWLMNCDSYLF